MFPVEKQLQCNWNPQGPNVPFKVSVAKGLQDVFRIDSCETQFKGESVPD